MEHRALKRQPYREPPVDEIERPVARALDRHRQWKEAISWARKLAAQLEWRDRQTIEWMKDRQRAAGLRQLHERNVADVPHEVSLKEHRLCSDCLFREGGKCSWYDQKIDARTKLCGGAHWQSKPAPVATAYAAEWLNHMNRMKAAHPQYFEGIDIGFLEDMAWEEEKKALGCGASEGMFSQASRDR